MKVVIKDNVTKTVTKVENVFWISGIGEKGIEICFSNMGEQDRMIIDGEQEPSITIYSGKDRRNEWKERAL